jgi:hypothetical protein
MKKIIWLIISLSSLHSFAADPKPGYLIDKNTGCKVWTGDVTSRSVQWSGACAEGYASGQGAVVMLKDGKKLYEANANYISGKITGYGEMVFSDGGKYMGEYRDGKRNGRGVLTAVDGSKYVGEYNDDQMHGKGIISFKDGSNYIGDMKNDASNGLGIDNYANGDMYIGEFKASKKNGQGIYVSKDGNLKEGVWESNKFIRETKVELPDINFDAFLIKISSQKNSNISGIPIKPSKIKSGFVADLLRCRQASDDYLQAAKRYANTPSIAFANYFSIAGYTYLTGCGVTSDFEEAKYWLELAAKYEDYEAIHNLAWFYHNGLGGEINLKKAVNLYTKVINSEKVSPSSKKISKSNVELIPDYALLIQSEPESLVAEKSNKNQSSAALKTTNTDKSSNQSPSKRTSQLSLEVNTTDPDNTGMLTIRIKTNEETASLTVNGIEEGSKDDGKYEIRRLAKVGQKNVYTIVAKDIFGTTATKEIIVERKASEAKVAFAELNPAKIQPALPKDAIAIIIGITDYKNLPKADFASEDARVFYDYAIRGLGIKPENIKLLIDADADQAEIYRAFKAWLPARVKKTTDVFVFYSGHGLPTADGKGLYLLPQRADRDFIDKTAINQQEINETIQALKPNSVTLFLDSCYSGAARTGQSLVASARPVTMKANIQVFPPEFTVITASTAEQISSSSPELKHGIFSYYLMKGMEGDADSNKDGKITFGEMQAYLVENVGRQAGMMSRKQEPQLVGDASRVLVGR